MKYWLLLLFFFTTLFLSAQVDSAALDSLKRNIAAQTRERRAAQDSVLKEVREAQSSVARQSGPAQKTETGTIAWWLAGLGAAALVAYVLTRKRGGRTS
jgi:hypothetical protein